MRIYLDHNASTPVDPRVVERFLDVEQANPANPGSLHHGGRRSRAALEQARREIAEVLDVEPDHVTFVSSGTEANNTAVRGLGNPDLPVLLAEVEHPSVLGAAEVRGASWWPVDAAGRARVQPPDHEVGLVTLVHGQSEVGTIQPVLDAADVAASCGAPLHVDVAQTLGRISVRDVIARADSLAISAHKVGGLRGLAVLVCKSPKLMRPLIVGGNQEAGRRAGTPSPGLAAATATAITLALSEQTERAANMDAARAAFDRGLQQAPCQRLSSGDCIPNTVMYRFDGLDNRSLLPALDLAGIEASAGSACSTGSAQPPRVLTAMGLTLEEAKHCIRFSFGRQSTSDDGTRAAETVASVVLRLRKREAAS